MSSLNNRIKSGIKSFHIYIIMAFAMTGFVSMHSYLKSNIIQSPTAKSVLEVTVSQWDGAAKKGDPQYNKMYFGVNDSVYTSTTKADGNKVSTSQYIYHRLPIFMIWTLLILISISLASGSFPVFVYFILSIRKQFNLNWNHVVLAVIAVIILLQIAGYSNRYVNGYFSPEDVIEKFGILFRSGSVLTSIITISFLLLIPELVTIFLIAVAASRIDEPVLDNRNEKDNEFRKRINQIEMLQKLLRHALQILAIIIVFSVLQSNALGNCIKNMLSIRGYDIFPEPISLLYGMFFSFFLGMIYIPVQLYLNYKIDRLRITVNDSSDNIDNEKEFLEALDKLSVKGSVMDNFKMVFTVMTPFISAFLPNLLHVFQ